MDWSTAFVLVALMWAISEVAKAFAWARAEVKQTEAEVSVEAAHVDERLFVIEQDLEQVKQSIGPEIIQ